MSHPSPKNEAKARLLLQLRDVGLSQSTVLAAIEQIPRTLFVAPPFQAHAWDDTTLPIDCGQTISQPGIVALMTSALDVNPRVKILEIGTGSGYQTAILSRLCRRVYTMERFPVLLRQAEARFAALHLRNITSRVGDGGYGWPEQAPFERIIVTAAAADIPPILVAQLAPGGILIVPTGEPEGPQDLLRIVKTTAGVDVQKLAPVRFVPMLAGVAP